MRELSLAIETPQGMVIVVGCAHTGIDNIVGAAATIQPTIQFVAGGLHYVVAKDPDIETMATTLRDKYRVAYLAPGHCTGEPTTADESDTRINTSPAQTTCIARFVAAQGSRRPASTPA